MNVLIKFVQKKRDVGYRVITKEILPLTHIFNFTLNLLFTLVVVAKLACVSAPSKVGLLLCDG